MPESFVTIREAAARLGEPAWRIAYLIERGDLPQPSLTVPGRRLFTDGDVERMRAAVHRRAQRKQLRPRGSKRRDSAGQPVSDRPPG